MHNLTRCFSKLLLISCVLQCLLLNSLVVEGRIHDLTIASDQRRSFEIETFGFAQDGTLSISYDSYLLGPSNADKKNVTSYIILRAVDDKSEAESLINLLQFADSAQTTSEDGDPTCLINFKHQALFSDGDNSQVLKLRFIKLETSHEPSEKLNINIEKAGRIQIFFQRCQDKTNVTPYDVSFQLHLSLKNPSGYLSAGDASLPGLFMAFAFLDVGLLCTWIYFCRRAKEYVHKIHMLMAALVLIKTLSVFFESLSYGAINMYGKPVAWTVLFYIFYFVKGLMIFVVILLLGMGWSFLRPFLKVEEKKFLLVILTLQVVANIAFVVTSSEAPGTQSWLGWSNILHLLDFLCCVLVVFPILYTIQHLQRTGDADGKKAITINRLVQFRELYFALMGYIYFSRLVLPFIASILPYEWEWSGYFLDEFSTLCLFVFIGYRFIPRKENPYIQVNDQEFDDEDLEALDGGSGSDIHGQDNDGDHIGEFGLDDEMIDLQPTTSALHSHNQL